MQARKPQALRLARRRFLVITSTSLGGLLWPVRGRGAIAAPPTNNPTAHLGLDWTREIRWANVVDVTQAPGASIMEKLASAQARVAAAGGGVVYFPPGVYRFPDSIQLKNGVVLRGADPAPGSRAVEENYTLSSQLEFPRYVFKAEGEGTPTSTAFKGIYLEDPPGASNCGVVNLAINRGHIHFKESADHTCGRRRLVFGCVLRNAARAWDTVPNLQIGQKPWQRWTVGYMNAAIDVKSAEDALIANNRLPRSGEDNFTMNGYVLLDRSRKPVEVDGVVFDYDNRAGIYLNHYGIGGPGGQGPDGTPETHPFGFRKGLIIRDNYVFNTGRCAIGFCGDGVQCLNNVIRFPRGVIRKTVTGQHLSAGSSTNDNRAVEMRGWRWVVSGNDYEVHRNIAADGIYAINDGEGLMHEDHVNSTIKDSVLSRNRGNAYLSLYKTAGIDGLLIEANEIHIDPGAGGEAAITVDACRVNEPFPCRNVRILNNTVSGQGISISGSREGSTGNVIRGNRGVGRPEGKPAYLIRNQANAVVEGNEGFVVETSDWIPHRERRALQEAERKRQQGEKAPRK